MIRNLKVLIAAAMALAAFGAFSATAHALPDEFHCSVEPCYGTLEPDEKAGTTTAHHVFVVKGKTAAGAEASTSFTCDQLTGTLTLATKTATEVTVKGDPTGAPKYENAAGTQKCKVGASETVEVDMTSCHYQFTAAGGTTDAAEVHVLCSTVGDGIDIKINGTLCLQVTPTTATGIGYRTVGTTPNRKITVTANVALPNLSLDLKNIGNANCSALGMASTTGATYTTGNTLVKGLTDPGGLAAEVWYE